MSRVIVALRTFYTLAAPYFRSEERHLAWFLLAGIVGAELLIVWVLVEVNHWNARFFSALEARNWDAVTRELFVYGAIAAGGVVAGMAQYWFGQTLLIRWRRWITERYLGLWMAEGRHYRLRFVDHTVDNIHLRIANDVLLFVTRTYEMGAGITGSLVTIISFTVILWGLSAIIPLPLFGVDLSFPGYLILTAMVYASIGTWLAHLIGRPLIPLNFSQQRFESDFRFAIARVTDLSEPVALMRGEPVEREEMGRRFARLVGNWTALVSRQSRLVGFVAGYSKVSTVFPTLVASPAYLAGAISLGNLMQAGLAFQQLEQNFAFFIGAYSKVAEWKAVMDRLAQFEVMMGIVEDNQHPLAHVSIVPSSGCNLAIDHLLLRVPSGAPVATLADVALALGERLLVSGPSGVGKSSFLRALAGLWPLGEGDIRMPAAARVLALPQRPYFPLGSLRQALAYPTPATAVDDSDILAAMALVRLDHLAGRLDEEAEWSTVLSGGEQQRVAFARALITRPTVLLLDEPVSTLEAADADELYRVIAKLLPETIVISIGRASALGHLHSRVIEMSGATMPGQPIPTAVPA